MAPTAPHARSAVAGRRFVPVLVLTEGFPVNPMTYEAIEGRLRGAGLLRGPRVGPLHILDQEEFELIEAVVAGGDFGLLQMLEEHEQAGLMRRMPFRDWLLRSKRVDPVRPGRLEPRFKRGWRAVHEALGDMASDPSDDD